MEFLELPEPNEGSNITRRIWMTKSTNGWHVSVLTQYKTGKHDNDSSFDQDFVFSELKDAMVCIEEFMNSNK